MASPLPQTIVETGFDSFNIHTTSYKKIGDHEIEVSVLIPKALKPGKHPLIVKWHGGGLVRYVSPTSSSFPSTLPCPSRITQIKLTV
jgi:cephalosporin-C deacetylase-like acetyl esterase